jgi:serine/threonine-protein kinase RsbW
VEATGSKTERREHDAVTRVSFRVPARLTQRALAFELVKTVVRHVPGADADFGHAVTTAFGEAFNNVVLHAYRGREGAILEVEADVFEGGLVLRLKDDGASANFEDVAEPDLDSLPEGGLGVFMMRALLDEVSYQAGQAGSPNVLTLTKRVTRAADAPAL